MTAATSISAASLTMNTIPAMISITSTIATINISMPANGITNANNVMPSLSNIMNIVNIRNVMNNGRIIITATTTIITTTIVASAVVSIRISTFDIINEIVDAVVATTTAGTSTVIITAD